jgi:gliding motility-associatede transport system auxiliary component
VNSRWIKARQTKYAAYATIYILVTLAIISVVNVLASRYNKSYDSTTNKQFSLSDQTVKIVKALSQPVTITYYDRATNFQSAKDLLDRYQTISSRVHVEYVDPDKKPEEARAAGITRYGTMMVQIGTKKDEAKSVTEEDITGAIIRDVKNRTRTVCFFTGEGEHQIDDSDPQDGYSKLKDALSKDNYETKTISLLEKDEIPADCTVLMIAGPKNDYSQPEVDTIKKYVEGGGRAMFLLDPPIKLGHPTADNDALTKVLQDWGVSLDKDLVLDPNPVGQLAGLGPQVALITKYEVNPIVDPMKGTATGFPLTRSMTVKSTDKTSVQKLFDTSDSSFATMALNTPTVNMTDPKNKKGPLTIAAEGSYTTGKENSEGRFVVIGTSTWLANSFLGFDGNSDLALNAMDWLSSDEDLISIRPKAPDTRAINMTQSQFSWVRLSTQFFFPGALLLIGVGVWWRRR